MIGRSALAFILCLMFSALAAQALGQDSVKLEYKFTPGEVIRYKMVMDMTIRMDMGQGQQIPAQQARMVMVMRQQTKKVLPNGDAEIINKIESMKANMLGKTTNMAADQFPVATMTMSRSGMVRDIRGLEGMNPMLGNVPLMNMGNIQSGPVFPTDAVKVGDTWTQEVPTPLGDAKLQVQSTLLSTGTKLGKHTVAVLTQRTDGKINLDMPLPVPSDGNSANGGSAAPSMDMNTDFIVNGTIYFSPERGQIVRMVGSANMIMTMWFPVVIENEQSASSDQPGTMNMDMSMKFEMFQLPSGKG